MSTPTVLRAGDSIAWTESLADYPASAGWEIRVRILWPTGTPYETTSTPDGDDHDLAIDAADSAAWPAGQATLVRLAERPIGPDDEERVTLSACPLQILPNLAAAATLDRRTQNERALDEAKAALEKHLASGRAHVGSYTISGRQMTFRTVDELRALIEYYQREVAAERARAAALNGYAPGRIFSRF